MGAYVCHTYGVENATGSTSNERTGMCRGSKVVSMIGAWLIFND